MFTMDAINIAPYEDANETFILGVYFGWADEKRDVRSEIGY